MPKQLRSADWFAKSGQDGFIHRSWMKNQGISHEEFFGKPVIGICNTWSELNPCNAHFRDLAAYVKKGVWQAGGFPLEFPVISSNETLMRPTTMLYRNLMSMDTEESIRSNPLDAVVLLCGCDKTTPALLMGAASVGLPTIVLSGGPMLNGQFHGKVIGSATDMWKFSEDMRAGQMSTEDFIEAESCMSRSIGHCNTMGTASTMAVMAEALGMTLPGNAAIPAADSRRRVMATMTGKRVVDMVWEDLSIERVVTRRSLENAIVMNAAVGGSSNFIIHLLAIAGRLQIDLDLEDFEQLSKSVPLLLDLMPSGKFLMEDFYYAGGLPALIQKCRDLIHTDVLTVTGRTLGENNEKAPCYNLEVIRERDNALTDLPSVVVVKGNLCPEGAIIKTAAATPELLQHRGRAVVFEGIEDYHARIDDPALDVEPADILVLKYVGPRGYPGMPEVGNMALPKKILAKGIRDMVRISDGRMSGTAFGAVFLHLSPESFIGGNLALVQNGDMITVDVANRRLELEVSDDELDQRREKWTPPALDYDRGYAKLYIDHVEQAHRGADLDFLKGKSGHVVKRESH